MDLPELLGLDHNDPEIIAAQEDVAEYEAVIAKLAKARKDARISQQQVADALHTSQPVISELERLAGNPTVSRLMEYARAVGQRLQLKVGDPVEAYAPTEPRVDYQISRVATQTTWVGEGFDRVERAYTPPTSHSDWQTYPLHTHTQ